MCFLKRYALKTAGLREKVGETYVFKGGRDRERCGKIVGDWMGEGGEHRELCVETKACTNRPPPRLAGDDMRIRKANKTPN